MSNLRNPQAEPESKHDIHGHFPTQCVSWLSLVESRHDIDGHFPTQRTHPLSWLSLVEARHDIYGHFPTQRTHLLGWLNILKFRKFSKNLKNFDFFRWPPLPRFFFDFQNFRKISPKKIFFSEVKTLFQSGTVCLPAGFSLYKNISGGVSEFRTDLR